MFAREHLYEVKSMGTGKMDHLVLTSSSDYPGVEFQFGEVNMIDEGNQLRLAFEYEVFDNPGKFDTESQEFEQYIGPILLDIMEQELVYENAQKKRKK